MTVGTNWLTAQDAAAILAVREDVIYSLIRDGEIKAINVAVNPEGPRPRWRISPVEVERFRFDREATSRGYVKR